MLFGLVLRLLLVVFTMFQTISPNEKNDIKNAEKQSIIDLYGGFCYFESVILKRFDADKICIAALAVGRTAGYDDLVAAA